MKQRPHVQIALVGGQPTPVYQGIVHLAPNQVVLVCSSQSRGMAEAIREQLPQYKDGDIMIYEISDDDIVKMYSKAEMIEQALPKGITISLNVTGGMKLWSIVFNNVFRRKRRSCRTFFIGQNGIYFDLKNKEVLPKVNFDMDAQFKILGHTVSEYTPLSDYTSQDFTVLNTAQSWGFSQNTHYPFMKLTDKFRDEYKAVYNNNLYRRPFSVTEGRNSLEWNPDTKSFDILIGAKNLTLVSEHVTNIVLNTGWFELYVARMISKRYPSSQIWLNCIFKNKSNKTKNEVDIIVNTGNKLLFVECKTQVYNTTDVDKFRSVVANYGGLGSKHLFVTWQPMKAEAREKCDDYGITTFHFADPSFKNNQDKIDALDKVLDELEKKWNFK